MSNFDGLQAHRISDGDAAWLVRGTTDPELAMRYLVHTGDAEPDAPAGDYDLEPVPMVERAGLFRINPCGPSSCGEHGWHLGYMTKPGRGVFPGVLLDVGWEEAEPDISELENIGGLQIG